MDDLGLHALRLQGPRDLGKGYKSVSLAMGASVYQQYFHGIKSFRKDIFFQLYTAHSAPENSARPRRGKAPQTPPILVRHESEGDSKESPFFVSVFPVAGAGRRVCPGTAVSHSAPENSARPRRGKAPQTPPTGSTAPASQLTAHDSRHSAHAQGVESEGDSKESPFFVSVFPVAGAVRRVCPGTAVFCSAFSAQSLVESHFSAQQASVESHFSVHSVQAAASVLVFYLHLSC